MKRNKKNNKGFSLIELVAAVTILMLVAIPLLQAFTTSASLTSKAKKIGEATAAAQNIQETIEALSVSDFQNLKNENVTDMLSIMGDDVERSEAEIEKDEYGKATGTSTMTVKNLESGSGTYDAKVTFSLGDAGTGIQLINNINIAQYTNLDTAFAQCGSTGLDKNPDDQADLEYKTTEKYQNDPTSINYKSRRIVVDITTEEDEEANVLRVYETVSFCYIYGKSGYSKSSVIDTKLNEDSGKSIKPIKRNTKYKEGSNETRYKDVDVEIDFELFPSGYEMSLEKDENGAYVDTYTAYILFYPYYYFKAPPADATSTSEERTVDPDYIEFFVDDQNVNASPLNTQFFVVKMWPMEKEIETGTNIIKWKKKSKDSISLADKNYKANIVEIRNNNYKKYIDSVYKGSLIKAGTRVYTNIRTKLIVGNTTIDDKIIYGNFAYKVRMAAGKLRDTYYIYDIKVGDEIKFEDSLVKVENADRFYNVKIEIYDSGKSESGKPVHTLEANKLT